MPGTAQGRRQATSPGMCHVKTSLNRFCPDRRHSACGPAPSAVSNSRVRPQPAAHRAIAPARQHRLRCLFDWNYPGTYPGTYPATDLPRHHLGRQSWQFSMAKTSQNMRIISTPATSLAPKNRLWHCPARVPRPLHQDESIGSPPAIGRAARLSTPALVRAVDRRPAPLTGQPCDDNAAVAQG